MRSRARWTVVVAALIAFAGQSTPALALHTNAVVSANACLAGKIKCVQKKNRCVLNLYRKSFVPDPLAIAKCTDKFQSDPPNGGGCFEKLEAKPLPCLSNGDAAVVAAKVDAFVKDLILQIDPSGAGTFDKCSNGKLRCVSKYDSCVLGAYEKAAKGGGTVGDISKCTRRFASCNRNLAPGYAQICLGGGLDGDACIGNLCSLFGGSCVAGPVPCVPVHEERHLLDVNDAFLDDVIAELQTAAADMNTQRCTGDTRVKCSNAPGGTGGSCTGLGTCEFFFGAPLPLSFGGLAYCVTNRWVGAISGTFDQQSGQSAGTAAVLATFYNGIEVSTPCPRCIGDQFPNDGNPQGTCSGGVHNLATCDANGQSPEGIGTFGDTSLDCGPSGQISSIRVDLSNTTGVTTQTVTAASPVCNGWFGHKCLCATCTEDSHKPCMSNADCTGTCTNSAGAPRQALPCVDDCTTLPSEAVCLDTTPGEGECPLAPISQHCRTQTFRSCNNDQDCNTGLNTDPDDTCGTYSRECFPGYNGQVGATISATGSVGSGPRNHAEAATFGAVFCVAPTTSSPWIDIAAGLPGPGRLQLAGVGFEQDTGVGDACPDRAAFLPTSKGGVLDVGWMGLVHDTKVMGQAKVTVAVSGCAGTPPNCGVCTYTGPIANPHALP